MDLLLVSVQSSLLAGHQLISLWRTVMDLAIDTQGVDHFSWVPTLATHQENADVAELAAHVPQHQLTPLEGLVSLVTAVGPEVLSLNLYARDLWVAGISDWGESLDLVLTSGSWPSLERELARLGVAWDLAEVEERPRWPHTASPN